MAEWQVKFLVGFVGFGLVVSVIDTVFGRYFDDWYRKTKMYAYLVNFFRNLFDGKYKIFYRIARLAPFAFLLVEIITLVSPTIWREHLTLRSWIDNFYWVWIFYVAFRFSPKWATLFVVWSFVPLFLGIESPSEGIRYATMSDLWLRTDALVAMMFILYEILIIEASNFYMSKLYKLFIVPKKEDGHIKFWMIWALDKIIIPWINACLKWLAQYRRRTLEKVKISPVVLPMWNVLCILNKKESTDLFLVECEDDVVDYTLTWDDGRFRLVFSGNKRLLDILQVAIRIMRGDGLGKALDFLLAHAEFQR